MPSVFLTELMEGLGGVHAAWQLALMCFLGAPTSCVTVCMYRSLPGFLKKNKQKTPLSLYKEGDLKIL